MKVKWLGTTVLTAAIACTGAAANAQAQTSSGSQGQTGTQAQTGANQGQQASQEEQREFVRDMLLANMAEIRLGQLGTERASNQQVRSFAQMMVTHHTKANQQLMPLAQQLNVERPQELDAKNKALEARLSQLQGAEFDRAYMEAMVAAHREVLDDTKPILGNIVSPAGQPGAGSGTAATSGTGSTTGAGTTGTGTATSRPGATGAATDQATAASQPKSVREYALMAAPIVQKHLQQAQQIQQSLGR